MTERRNGDGRRTDGPTDGPAHSGPLRRYAATPSRPVQGDMDPRGTADQLRGHSRPRFARRGRQLARRDRPRRHRQADLRQAEEPGPRFTLSAGRALCAAGGAAGAGRRRRALRPRPGAGQGLAHPRVEAAGAVRRRRSASRPCAPSQINPRHDGAWHVLGRWNAEVERLSNLQEFFAKTVLGGKVLGEASWEEAIRCMRNAVELRPDYIFHRLDLAEMLIEIKRREEARPHLEKIQELPQTRRDGRSLRARASMLLGQISGRRLTD